MNGLNWLERHPRLEKFPIPATVLVLVLALSAFLVTLAVLFSNPVSNAMANTDDGGVRKAIWTRDTLTKYRCEEWNCEEFLTAPLKAQLLTTEAREADAWAALAKKEAEIERLQEPDKRCRLTLGEGGHASHACVSTHRTVVEPEPEQPTLRMVDPSYASTGSPCTFPNCN